MKKTNKERQVRRANGSWRNKCRLRFRAMDAPCGICNGKYGRIHYEEPSDPKHPLSFVIDEIKPISRWKEFGYRSAQEAVMDWNNLQAAHRVCNAMKSNKTVEEMRKAAKPVRIVLDGEW